MRHFADDESLRVSALVRILHDGVRFGIGVGFERARDEKRFKNFHGERRDCVPLPKEAFERTLHELAIILKRKTLLIALVEYVLANGTLTSMIEEVLYDAAYRLFELAMDLLEC